MIEPLAAAGVVVSAGSAGLTGLRAFADRFRWRPIIPVIIGLQISVLLHAASDVAVLVDGRHPPLVSTHVAYLVVALAVLPCVVVMAMGDEGRWSGALLAVALVVLAVVLVRMQVTWRGA